MKKSVPEDRVQSQELHLLSDLSPPAGSSSPNSFAVEAETGAAPRSRTRMRAADAPSTSSPPLREVPTHRSDPHAAAREPSDVKQMEADLLGLMQDFNDGNLRAFGKDVTMEQMERIREQQEGLAKLHFEMGAQQELFPPLSEEGLSRASTSLQELMAQLQSLSTSIEKLHTRPEPAQSAQGAAPPAQGEAPPPAAPSPS